MNLVSNELDLPLFLVSRNRFKYQHSATVQNYIAKQRAHLQRPCAYATNESATATQSKLQELVGLDKRGKSPCPNARTLKITRDLNSAKSWQLSPNRYNIANDPFAGLRGKMGAYWPKSRSLNQPMSSAKPQFCFYDKPGDMECLMTTCNRHKGTFLSNARERRSSTRGMVSNSLTCYRDPAYPCATTHYDRHHEISQRVSKPVQAPKPNPHIFLRNTTVPAKPNAIHARNISYCPAPGRYENRFVNVCHCSSNLKYASGVQLQIDREKRFKFRRLPFTKISGRHYCSPEWRHVTGNGHRWLFRRSTKTEPKLKVSKETKKSDKQYFLYPDARYIHMINEPHRLALSMREVPLERPPTTVLYNCTAKRIVRRQLRNNKKIAFMSGQERFKDSGYRMLALTARQLEQKKMTLPVERQLRDHMVMRVPASEIKGKLNETPSHMRPEFELRLRKRLFKFLPLPTPKILVRRRDSVPEGMRTTKQPAFFAAPLNVMDFCMADTDSTVAAASEFLACFDEPAHILAPIHDHPIDE